MDFGLVNTVSKDLIKDPGFVLVFQSVYISHIDHFLSVRALIGSSLALKDQLSNRSIAG